MGQFSRSITNIIKKNDHDIQLKQEYYYRFSPGTSWITSLE